MNLKTFVLIVLLGLVKSQEQNMTKKEICAEYALCDEDRDRCVAMAVSNPKEWPSPDERCSTFYECLASQNLEEKFALFELDMLGESDPGNNCTALRYGVNRTIVDTGPFLDFIELENETAANEFQCCFEIGTYVFDSEKYMNKSYFTRMFSEPVFQNPGYPKAVIAALDYCNLPSPKCDGSETMSCVLSFCKPETTT